MEEVGEDVSWDVLGVRVGGEVGVDVGMPGGDVGVLVVGLLELGFGVGNNVGGWVVGMRFEFIGRKYTLSIYTTPESDCNSLFLPTFSLATA